MAFNRKDIGNAFKSVFASTETKEREQAVQKLVSAIKNQRSLYRKEIVDWKNARAAALQPENPRRKQLIDLYEDILGDAFIFGITDTRKLRVSNKAFSITNAAGEVDDEKTKLLQKSWFNEFVKTSVETIYFGYSLMYPKQLDKNGLIKKMALVYRDHIVPETTELLKNSFDTTGVNFTEAPYNRWTVWINHDQFLGLLDKAAPLWIFKKHSWQNWDEFEEMFGIPMRTAKVASTDPRVQAEVDKWLQDFGSSNFARFPEGVEFEIKESNSRDSFNVFNEKRKACNEELATLFDGNSEGSKDSGSRAKSETIIDSTQALIALDDETRVRFIVQDELLPFLINMGYPFAEDDQFIWNENKKLTPQERLNIFKGVHDLGYKVKKEQIETELDVELEEEEIVEPPEPVPGKVPKMENPPAPPKKPQARANFKKPHAHSGSCECGADDCYRRIDFTLLNALSDDEEAFLKQYFENPDSIKWSYKEFKASHGKLLEGLREGFNGVDADFESEDHVMMQLFQSNVHRFGVDKTFKEIMDLNEILKTSKDYSEFRQRAKALFPNYRENWLRTEYDQAYTASRFGARYIQMMKDIAIAPFWRLVAILDGRTTKICDSLHNRVFSKLDAKAWQFLPPNHWKCRSDAEDVLAGYTGTISTFDDAVAGDPDGYDRMVKTGFAVNWGDSKQVFGATQSYLHNAGVEPLDVQTLTFKDYGLVPQSEMNELQELLELPLLFSSLMDRSGLAKFMDVFELPVWMEKVLFESTEAKIRNNIKDIMTNPSEVFWHTEGDVNYKTFLKFYKKETLQVITSFTDKEIAKIIKVGTVDNVDQLRKGLLLYTPKEHIATRLAQYESFSKEYKRISFNGENGGFIVTHNLHNASELGNNLLTSKVLSDMGKAIELLPTGELKTADALINSVEFEFKLLTNYSNLFNRVKAEIKRALTQSPNVLLHINNDHNIDDIIRGVHAGISNDTKGKAKFIGIVFNDKRFFLFSRKQIQTKEFVRILKQ
ncbi:phage portal protein family protein [Flavobacterium algoritolerans]|uniref:DUF935 family protein n=1 Tax=Flavobacterium algoritolerans TaxID=3041254 RepID=A0ABT6V829_9FLAO|nr:DUF935 family protein [Flavobacterium algoritolerans]MDI5894387.1 DUF935 family protein [Flavobacterium algoritolerans]